ncbi:hypothetical protein Q5O24_00960 [Eubacteriaceae bacterium ES3]|nr:hypothetical protein Q5O24_00960 [Eubacteriaceae bacterium ES3]
MPQIRKYHKPPEENEPASFSVGFPLAVTIILIFMVVVIIGLVNSINKTTNAAAARVIYLAAQAKAIEFSVDGNYHVPVQEDLINLIGQDINQNAQIEVIDENFDAKIDYIIYHKKRWVTTYSPGQLDTKKEK